MKRAFLTLSAVLVTFSLLTAGPAAAVGPAPATSPYIVVFKGVGNVDSQTGSLQQAFGFLSSFRYTHAIRGFAARLTSAQATALSRLPFVAFVAPDQTVQADGTTPIQSGDSAPTGIRRISAATTTVAHGASGVAVAIIDTGGSFNNPDLNEISGTNCVSPGSLATDDNGHATHVAGTIGAKNNGSGVVGVAPGTTLYAVKVLNSAGSGTWSQVICGIDWVTANAASLNIKVASMSLGGSGSNDNNCGQSNFDPLHTAICNSVNAGVTYVVAAGNNAANMASFTPAAYPEVLAVTAMTDSDGKSGGIGGSPTCRTGEADDYYASFSNYAVGTAAQNHTIAGPGVCILSDWLNNGFNTISGTSMATPHVSGSVALCLAQGSTPGPCAGMTPSQIIQKMRTDAANHAAAVPGDGFQGDPAHAISGRYYGYLVWDGADLGGSPPPTPDFSISASPSSRTVTQGAGTSYSITITPQNGFASSVSLSVSGLGSGAGGSFSPSPATTSSTLSITTTASATTGSFPLTITGTSGSLTHQTGVTLVVNPSGGGSTVPDPPNLTSATAGNGSVALAWSAPGNNGGSPLTGYNVYRGTSSGAESLLTSLGLQTSYTDSPVSNGTTYWYVVRAVNVNGPSGPSNERSATPSGGTTVPAAPSLNAATAGNASVSLSWSPNSNGGSPITGYIVLRSTSPGAEIQIATLGTQTSYVDTGVINGTVYYYTIKAVNGLGPSPASNERSALPRPPRTR